MPAGDFLEVYLNLLSNISSGLISVLFILDLHLSTLSHY